MYSDAIDSGIERFVVSLQSRFVSLFVFFFQVSTDKYDSIRFEMSLQMNIFRVANTKN